jgi:putative oxidoreductase
MHTLTAYWPPVARLLISILFIISGFGKLAQFAVTAQTISLLGVPFPVLATTIVILVEILGGISVLVGFFARFGAAALALFSIITAFMLHGDFTEVGQQIHFMKNLAIAGGLLYIVSFGAGGLSFDHRTQKQPED